MLKVYNCIATAHDLRLVALAAFVDGRRAPISARREFTTGCRGYLLGRPAAIGNFRQYTHGEPGLDAEAELVRKAAGA
jgi:hypothetical protein